MDLDVYPEENLAFSVVGFDIPDVEKNPAHVSATFSPR
jgi:hypothetical protein